MFGMNISISVQQARRRLHSFRNRRIRKKVIANSIPVASSNSRVNQVGVVLSSPPSHSKRTTTRAEGFFPFNRKRRVALFLVMLRVAGAAVSMLGACGAALYWSMLGACGSPDLRPGAAVDALAAYGRYCCPRLTCLQVPACGRCSCGRSVSTNCCPLRCKRETYYLYVSIAG